METPLQITFHSLPRSDAIQAKVRQRARRLEKYCDSIVSCRVEIDAPHHHHGAGNQFQVRVELTVPGEVLVANRAPDEHPEYADAHLAVRDAFDAVRRQLQDYVQRRGSALRQYALD